jgi:hypothetical protein
MAISDYQLRALECFRFADDNATSSENRTLLVGIAQAWLKLAQRVEQNSSADLSSRRTSPPVAATAL